MFVPSSDKSQSQPDSRKHSSPGALWDYIHAASNSSVFLLGEQCLNRYILTRQSLKSQMLTVSFTLEMIDDSEMIDD